MHNALTIRAAEASALIDLMLATTALPAALRDPLDRYGRRLSELGTDVSLARLGPRTARPIIQTLVAAWAALKGPAAPPEPQSSPRWDVAEAEAHWLGGLPPVHRVRSKDKLQITGVRLRAEYSIDETTPVTLGARVAGQGATTFKAVADAVKAMPMRRRATVIRLQLTVRVAGESAVEEVAEAQALSPSLGSDARKDFTTLERVLAQVRYGLDAALRDDRPLPTLTDPATRLRFNNAGELARFGVAYALLQVVAPFRFLARWRSGAQDLDMRDAFERACRGVGVRVPDPDTKERVMLGVLERFRSLDLTQSVTRFVRGAIPKEVKNRLFSQKLPNSEPVELYHYVAMGARLEHPGQLLPKGGDPPDPPLPLSPRVEKLLGRYERGAESRVQFHRITATDIRRVLLSGHILPEHQYIYRQLKGLARGEYSGVFAADQIFEWFYGPVVRKVPDHSDIVAVMLAPANDVRTNPALPHTRIDPKALLVFFAALAGRAIADLNRKELRAAALALGLPNERPRKSEVDQILNLMTTRPEKPSDDDGANK